MGFSRQEYWSGLPSPPPGHLPNPGIEPVSPALQVYSLLLSHHGSPSTGSQTLNLMKDTQLILFTAWRCQLFWRRTLFIYLAVLVERKWKSLSRVGLFATPIDYTVYGILQARILEWLAVPFSRGSSQRRNQTQVTCIAGGLFTSWAASEAFCELWAKAY